MPSWRHFHASLVSTLLSIPPILRLPGFITGTSSVLYIFFPSPIELVSPLTSEKSCAFIISFLFLSYKINTLFFSNPFSSSPIGGKKKMKANPQWNSFSSPLHFNNWLQLSLHCSNERGKNSFASRWVRISSGFLTLLAGFCRGRMESFLLI